MRNLKLVSESHKPTERYAHTGEAEVNVTVNRVIDSLELFELSAIDELVDFTLEETNENIAE